MNEKLIASNMIAIARGRKGDAKRSAMLRMIMPFMSNKTGEKLAKVIHDSDSAAFGKIWDGVKHEILKRLKNKHKLQATAADMRIFQRDDESVINVDMYGSEKLRVTIEGVDVWNGTAPGYREMVDPTYDSEQSIESRVAELNPVQAPVSADAPVPFETHDGLPVEDSINKAIHGFFRMGDTSPEANIVEQEPRLALQFDFGQTGWNYEITDGQLVNVLHEVCQRLLYKEDPCPLAPVPINKDRPTLISDINLQELSAYFTACKS